MDEKTKQTLIIIVAVLALGAAAVMGFQTFKPEEAKVNVVGELPMPEGGGRDAESGKSQEDQAADVSGMPAELR